MMGAAKAQQPSCLGLSGLCVGQDDLGWEEASTLDSKIDTHDKHGSLI